jgi:hypothetical protein
MGSKTYCVSLGFCKILDSAQIEDVELLDELEMRADVEALRQARAEDDGTRISLEEFLAEGF